MEKGKKVRYKVGRGSAVGTVCMDTGTHVFIETAKGKKISRKIQSIVSEEQPDPALVPVEKVQDFPIEQIEPMGF